MSTELDAQEAEYLAYDGSHILDQIDALVAEHGVNETARRLGLSYGYLCDVHTRRRKPGPKVIAALGMQKVVVYVKKPLDSIR